MKYSLTYLFVFLVIFANAQLNQKKVREAFYYSVENSERSDTFNEVLVEKKQELTPVLIGYLGMSHLLLAKHAFNPYTKLSQFYKGKGYLEKAIEEAPGSVELRFLRFSVQTNAPFFLDYNNEIEEDKMVLMKYATTIKNRSSDPDLYERITNYLFETNFSTKDEKTQIKQTLEKIEL